MTITSIPFGNILAAYILGMYIAMFIIGTYFEKMQRVGLVSNIVAAILSLLWPVTLATFLLGLISRVINKDKSEHRPLIM